MNTIDLRSDTVTHPTPAMFEAMSKAKVGDDVYGEDPSINRLEELSAAMLGKEAGLYVPSGTMGNLVAVFTQCTRGDEIILGNLSHAFLLEAGGISALGSVGMSTIPNLADGTMDLDAIRAAIRGSNPRFPISRMILLENTHNRCGGAALTREYTQEVGDIAHDNGMYLHIDGARIFNAAAAFNIPVTELVEPADTVTFCVSKALCAPVGSVLCGSKEFIEKARHIRKQIGGGMRQAGIIASAGIVALEQMTGRLAEDHERASKLAKGLSSIPGIFLHLQPPIPTNMVFIALDEDVRLNAAEVIARLKLKGILVGAVGPRHFRLVTHYWISDDDIDLTIQSFKEILL
ncbi:MAG: low-specificity L-threonine aldolase [Anaerolineaceae bacterium]|nr:low-specificity L-threonine aldolase [Anaerolineaceae bacterium]